MSVLVGCWDFRRDDIEVCFDLLHGLSGSACPY